MNFRENETKRYFQKNFLSLSLVHTQRRFQRVNYDNYKIGQDASKYFLFHNARNIIFWLTRYYYKGLKRELIIFINWKTVPLRNIFIYKILPFLSKEFQISTK